MKPFYIVLFVSTIVAFINIFNENLYKDYNPDKERVRVECVNGNQVAMNDNGYKRPLLDENNNPLRCVK